MRIGACVLLLAVLAGCEGPDDEGVVSAPLRVCAAGPTTEGIDVSHWQGTIDWDDVAASGVRFAFVRVSDGLEYPDAEFDRNWAEARRVGLYRGAYQYFRASQDPIEQADYLLEHMGPLEPDDLPPVIDFEGDDGATLDEVQHGVRAWIAYVQAATGRRPIVYSGRYAWPDTGLMDVTPSVLWVPQYGRICPDIPAPWTRWAFFQYTGSGAIDGIAGRVDLDRFDGDEAALRVFIGVDARCGDGLCTGAESAESCAEDCPSCEPIPPEGRTIEETELCFERWGPASGYRMVDGEGSGDSLLFTYAIEPPSKLYAYWHFDVEEAGRYRLEVHTPAPYNETRAAPYVVRHAGIEEPVTLDQSQLDGWQVLGEYELASGGDQWLMIADGTGEPSDDHIRVVMDAVRLTRTDLAPVLDAGIDDGGMPDAGVADAGVADAGSPPVDAAMQPDVRVLRGTCGCRAAGARDRTPLWLALAPIALLLRRARS